MKNLKRILCLMLALVFCVTVFVGCKKDNAEGTDTTTAAPSGSGSGGGDGDTVDPKFQDTLGEKDFGGKTFKISSRSITDHDFDDKSTNEGVEDLVRNAVYTRNEAVKGRLNVNFSIQSEKKSNYAGNFTETDGFNQKYNGIIQSEKAAYDMITGHMSSVTALTVAGENRAYAINTLPGLDITKGWWSASAYENVNLMGKLYMAVGDATVSIYELMYVMFFNETLANDLIKDETGEPVDLYELVENGEWTFETFKEYANKVTVVKDEAYGFLSSTHNARMFQMSFKLEIAQKDNSTGKWFYAASASERTIDAANEMRDFLQSSAVKTTKDGGYGYDYTEKYFTLGQSLFYGQEINEAKKIVKGFSEANLKFGIIPLPKYDEAQLDYATSMRDSGTGIIVPSNIENPELVGYCLEALSMYGYEHTRPAYYETVLKQHYLGTPKLAEMLDDIRSTFTIAFEQAYCIAFGAGYNATSDQATTSFYSDYSSNHGTWQTKLDTVYSYIGA